MVESRSGGRRLLTFQTTKRGSLALLFISACFAQTAGRAPAIALTATASGCGAILPQTAVQQELEAKIHNAGLTVSRIHTSTLAADIDCVPVNAARSAIAVHQCLAMSTLVSVNPDARGATLATTWRKCQSYTCTGAKCDAQMRAELQAQADVFVTDYRARNAEIPAPPPAQPPPAVVPQPVSQPIAAASSTSVLLTPATIYYMVYIMLCLAVLARWEYKKQQQE